MARTTSKRRCTRGSTLLEAVVALTVLMIGIVGMFRLQIFGATSDEGARAHTQALQVGAELLTALQRLPVDDPRLGAHFVGATTPPGFGQSGPWTVYSDSAPLQGVRWDSDFVAAGVVDPADGAPRFQRRWSVWMPSAPATGGEGSKLIAVSVVWQERGVIGPREAVLYGTTINPAAVTTSIASQR